MKKKIPITIVIFLLLTVGSTPAFSQPDTLWTRTYGVVGSGDKAFDMKKTDDGGYIMAGDIDRYFAYVVRTDSLGKSQWNSTFGDSSYITVYSICGNEDGYIIAGTTGSSTYRDYGEKLMGNNRASLKSSAFNRELTNMPVLQKENIFLTKGTLGSSYYRDFYLMAINNSGDSLWSKIYEKEGTERAYSTTTTNDGGYILAGVINDYQSSDNWYVVKTDALGDTLWTRIYQWNGTCYANSIVQTSDGGYIIAGYRDGGACIVKTDAMGEINWERWENDYVDRIFFSVKQTSDEGYIAVGAAGFGNNGSYYYIYYIVKYDYLGNKQWERSFGYAPYWNIAHEVEQIAGGGYIVAGFSNDFYNSGDISPYFVRMNVNGDSLWTLKLLTQGSVNMIYATEKLNDHEYAAAGHFDYDTQLMKIREIPFCEVDMLADDEPPIKVPPGGSLGYTATLANRFGEPLVTDVWVGVYYHGDFYQTKFFQGAEPVEPGEIITRHLVQNIPDCAPEGYYRYTAYCGDYPSISDSVWFGFGVENQLPVIPKANRDWSVEEVFLSGGQPSPDSIGNKILAANFHVSPNPFNASTRIDFNLPEAGHAKLEIYDLMGRKVEVLIDEYKDAGNYSVIWNAESYPSGIYFCKLTQGPLKVTKKMGLVK